MPKRRGHGEGSIYERKDGRWCAAVTVGRDAKGRLKRRYLYGATRREVQQALTKLLGERQRGALVDPSRETVEAFLERWLRDYAAHNVRPATYQCYRYSAKRIVRILGQVRLSALRPAMIQEFYSQELAEVSSQTVRHSHTVLHEALGHAVRWGLLMANPVDAVAAPRVQRGPVTAWTAEQAARFLEAAKEDRFHVAYVLSMYLGLGRGEVLGLKWSDLDLERGAMAVRRQVCMVGGKVSVEPTKTKGRQRPLELDAELVAALKKHRAAQNEERLRLGAAWQDEDWVFPSQQGGPMDPQRFYRLHFKAAVERAGLTLPGRLGYHAAMRHTFASLSLQAGVPVNTVSAGLGHTTSRMTLDTYSHLMPGMQREATRRIREALAGADRKPKPGSQAREKIPRQ